MKKHRKNPTRKRTERRTAMNPRVMRKNFLGIMKVIDKHAADHEGYMRSFFGGWLEAAENLDRAAELVLRHRTAKFEGNWAEGVLYPYTPFALLFFARLMDHLELDEEAQFRSAAEKYGQAMQKFLAAVGARHAALKDATARAYESHLVLMKEVSDLYLGEIKAEFTPPWANAYTSLEKDMAAIFREVSA